MNSDDTTVFIMNEVAGIETEPAIWFHDWQVMHLDIGCHMVMGWHVRPTRGRLSSPIVTIDPATRTLTSMSGRRYILIGEPGHCDSAHVLLQMTLAGLGTTARDDTAVFQQILAGAVVPGVPDLTDVSHLYGPIREPAGTEEDPIIKSLI